MSIVHFATALLACSGLLFHQPDPTSGSPTVNELYRVGREELSRRGYENLKKARESFLAAIALETNFAPAHAGLAEACALLGDYSGAEEAALRALELDDSLARGHAALGFVQLHARWNWPQAEREFRTAIALDAGDALAHHWYAIHLEVTGRNERAIAEARTALELDPAVQAYALGVAYRLFWARQYETAVEQFELLVEGDSDLTSAHYFLGRSYTELDRLKKAMAALNTARRLAPRDLNVAAALGYLHARSEQRSEALSQLGKLHKFSALGYPLSTQIASIYTALGELDTALQWLERAHEEHEGPVLWLKVDPRFDPLRSNPRFSALLAELQLLHPFSPPGPLEHGPH